MMRFQIEGDIFANLLNGPADKHVPRDFHARERGWIYSSFDRIIFINVQAHRPVWKADCIECVVISH